MCRSSLIPYCLKAPLEHHHWKVDVWRLEALETVVREKEGVVRGRWMTEATLCNDLKP